MRMLGGPPQSGDDTRNLVIAVVLSIAIMAGFEFFWAAPQRAKLAEQEKAKAQIEQQAAAPAPEAAAPPPVLSLSRDQALEQNPRIRFDNSAIDGSINLEGARFDDLSLKRHFQTIDDKKEVVLLQPQGAKGAYDAFFGWENPNTQETYVNSRTGWTAPAGATLTPKTPVTLTAKLDNGLVIERVVAMDEQYVFTITDKVSNTGEATVTLRPFATVRRAGLPEDFVANQIVHQGMLGVFGPKPILHEARYQKGQKHAKDKAAGKKLEDARLLEGRGQGGWLGVSDHYWLAALLPPQQETIDAWYDSRLEGADTNFRAAYRGGPRTLAPGQATSYVQHFFAGAKEVDLLKGYQKNLNIPDFDKAVDWGFLFILTRLFFSILDTFGNWFGNFGLAILAATVVVRATLFPLANQSYKSMASMKKIQPKMQEIQKRFEADKARQQQEIIKLYQEEKVNPLAGCLPILVQIPIFYALYKVLTVTIEMRHAPFFGWIRDLSAPDPTSILNLFGLLSFAIPDPNAVPLVGPMLHIGILPILYGITMWGVQSLSPPAPDPTQRQIFALMPFLFVFLFAKFAAGLVLYWTWSNLLSYAQQYAIMRRNGVETELDKFIAKRFRPAQPAE